MIFLEFYGTIGPACAQLETLQRMVEAGMTGIRMNLSHGPLSAHKDWLDMIHAVGIPQLLINLIDLLCQKSDLIFILHMKCCFRF